MLQGAPHVPAPHTWPAAHSRSPWHRSHSWFALQMPLAHAVLPLQPGTHVKSTVQYCPAGQLSAAPGRHCTHPPSSVHTPPSQLSQRDASALPEPSPGAAGASPSAEAAPSFVMLASEPASSTELWSRLASTAGSGGVLLLEEHAVVTVAKISKVPTRRSTNRGMSHLPTVM
jgi:hypothetical protein